MTTLAGDWRRRGATLVLDDPFDGRQSETGPGAGPPRRPGIPSTAQLDLLRAFFGSDEAGARRRTAAFAVPPGLTRTTLRWYAGIARRALADPVKASPKAVIVQNLRLQLVARALAVAPDPELETSGSDPVRRLQQDLNRVLESNLAVDGRLGARTTGAVRTFQQLSGLAVDGVPGRLTGAALRAAAVAPCTNLRQPCSIVDGFAFDGARVPPAHHPTILAVARCVLASLGSARPMRSLRVEGHTDSEGSDDYNRRLGLRRATEVARLLTAALDRMRPGSAAQVSIVPRSRGENDPASPDPARNRRVVICLPHCSCAGFFREYDLISSPSARFGVAADPRMSQADRDQRNADVGAMVRELVRRRDGRAREALAGRIPPPEPVSAALLPVADRLSDAQLALFRECFPGGHPVIDFAHLGRCFERFANGELRDPVAGAGPDPEGVGEPEGGFYFLFAEFAFLCVDSKLNDWLWAPAATIMVLTQELFMHVYRVDRRAPAPPVGAPLPARGPATRDLDAGYAFSSFNAAAQSDEARKAALRARYGPMDLAALRAAARDNLLRAQRMP